MASEAIPCVSDALPDEATLNRMFRDFDPDAFLRFGSYAVRCRSVVGLKGSVAYGPVLLLVEGDHELSLQGDNASAFWTMADAIRGVDAGVVVENRSVVPDRPIEFRRWT
jgi:hypothetical protein